MLMDPDPLTNIDPDPGQPTASRSGSKTLVCGFSTQMFLRGRILTVEMTELLSGSHDI
jgi:hypothetical protein